MATVRADSHIDPNLPRQILISRHLVVIGLATEIIDLACSRKKESEGAKSHILNDQLIIFRYHLVAKN